MNAVQPTRRPAPTDYLPLAFGLIGLLVGAVYQAQRAGLFLHSFYNFDRFIQHHLNATAGVADTLLPLLAIVIGLVIRKIRGRNRILDCGIAFSGIVILILMFGLSL